MTRGFVKLPRSFFVCPLWTEGHRRTQIEAYFDLLQRQAFHNTSVPQTGGHVDLKSGQLFISCRKLAVEWKWQARQVKDFLEYLRDLQIARLEEMQAGYRITLHDPVPDPSKNLLVTSLSSEDSSKKEEITKNSKNYDLKNLPDNATMREYKALHAEYPGVLESVEFIEFKEKKRLELRKPGFSPQALRQLILEFQTMNPADEDSRGDSATPENEESSAEVLHETAENG